jgi:hypothetical protein
VPREVKDSDGDRQQRGVRHGSKVRVYGREFNEASREPSPEGRNNSRDKQEAGSSQRGFHIGFQDKCQDLPG